ncbi:sensor domain-containing protein [Streptomyces cocklensis]|uniref:histidine kinase n=1 Tax=Actinacidiphila cocklensis TaxID=887465 RepID=A0A9W4DJL5_9ACTN|nr:sensor histidine kinase [Actinacidiphila cocklensis]MDD1061085.1 sensor domain-containing protein [Actinacidiphila cocklensis]CAG6391404.1 Signal transduction histidine kinase [Actinacidiphila cocklensis]
MNASPPSAYRSATDAAAHSADRSDSAALPPPRFAFDAVTWREILNLLLNLPMAIAGFIYVVTTLSVGAGLSVTVVGLPVLALGLLGCRALGSVERARARSLLGVQVEDPRPLRPGTLGFLPWLWMTLKDPVGWRHALYLAVRLPWGIFTFTVTLTSLFVAWPVLPFLARWMSGVDRALVRGLLQPSDELEKRIAELESDRGVVVDTAAADLRRIERDLHDGAQARLVALAMDLGLAKEKLLEDPEAAARMVDEAHGEVKIALQELRDLARGIHPAILTDRGLDAALSSVATRCTVPVTVIVDLPARPAEAIEGIAYFTVSELLQNVSKHSGAPRASVDVWRASDRLMIQVRDDGRGGADVSAGSGLAGLAERLDSVDGLFVVASPPGGPTVVTAELPWRDRDFRR